MTTEPTLLERLESNLARATARIVRLEDAIRDRDALIQELYHDSWCVKNAVRLALGDRVKQKDYPENFDAALKS
jgi:hypothetical protein